jgi:hypothetical protein
MRIVETDNHGSDYPDEKFVLGILSEEAAKEIVAVINKHLCRSDYASRYWKVVSDEYELVGGFEP